MDNQETTPRKIHFHIRWSGEAALDWQGFQSRDEAEACAKDIVRPSESFTIEEFDESCLRCKRRRAAVT